MKEKKMKKKIDKTEALALLVRATNERGADYVDRGDHRYFTDSGTPSCGVGLALSYMGVNRHHVDGVNYSRVHDMVDRRGYRLPIVLDDGAIKVLEKFRYVQDQNKPWGEALTEAAKV